MTRRTTELTITRVTQETGPDSFILTGKAGQVHVDFEDDGLWHIRERTGTSHECRTKRDQAIAWAIDLACTAFSLTGAPAHSDRRNEPEMQRRERSIREIAEA